MKKIILLTFILLFSCNKINNTDEKIKNTDNKIISEKSTSKETIILEKQNISKEILSWFSKKTLLSQSEYNCEETHPIYNWMVKEEKDIRDNFVSSCNKLKQDAKNKLNEKLNTFNISDCEDILNKIKKFSNLKSQNMNIENINTTNSQKYLTLIEACEFNIATKKWCELLKNTEKQKKCIEYKNIIENINITNQIKEFDLKKYL